jgi:type IV secretion system protein VirB10
MRIFSRETSDQGVSESGRVENASGEAGSSDFAEEAIAGDRGIPSINRARSIQSRTSSVLAIALMTALGLGLLSWYYTKALNRPIQAQHAAQAAAKTRAQGEMALPPLGPIESPFVRKAPAPSASAPPQPDATAMERLLGPAPPLPVAVAMPVGMGGGVPPQAGTDPTPQKSPGELAFERRLAGPAFARASTGAPEQAPTAIGVQATDVTALSASHGRLGDAGADSAQTMNALLRPTVTPAVTASVLPTRRFLLSKGAFIDCTLETAIDSTLPGMTTCVTATDTFSADGSVVLLERGTKLVGETRGQVQQGSARIFVLWTEARTPTGVVVPLGSPGTDELGRSGLAGEVNRHFWDRFGAAILLTVINGAVQGAVQSQNSGSSVIVSPSTTSDVMTEVLRSTVNISPTVTKAQGDRIQVFVARDVDFRPVYALRMANAAGSRESTP